MGILEALQGIGDLGSSIFNAWNTVKTNEQNQANQETEWRREDSAVQRRVADLKAAGLNPVLAASGAGAPSSLAVRMQAPQFDMPDMSRFMAFRSKQLAQAQTEADVSRLRAESDISRANSVIAQKRMSQADQIVSNEVERGRSNIQEAAANAAAAQEYASQARIDRMQKEFDYGMAKKYGEAGWWTKQVMGGSGVVDMVSKFLPFRIGGAVHGGMK